MDEPILSEERRWSGQWWLPENPENKVSGVLSYEPHGGLTLTLIGGWEHRVLHETAPGVTTFTGETRRWETIHGRAEGKFLTVLDARFQRAKTFLSARMFTDGPDELVLHAQTVLVGCHLNSPDDSVFESAIVTAENMTSWSRQGGVTISHTVDEVSGDRSIGISSETVAPLRATINDLTAKLEASSLVPGSYQNRSGTVVELREWATLQFESEGPRPLGEWTRMMSSVEDLLSLSTLRACALISMRVFLPATPDKWPDDHPLKNTRHEVQVYQQRIVTPHPGDKAVEPRDFVLTLDDVPFEELFPKWHKVHGKFAAARSMILGLRYVTDGYLESKVVTAVAAAESMSRALKPKSVMTRQELKQLRTAILAVVPEERKTWVHERFTNADPTLRDRLEMLASRPGEFMSDLVPNPSAWAASAANARNKIAHVGKSRHTLDELYAVVEVTTAVVIMNFLLELGVPPDRMKRALSEHPRLAAAARMAREMFTDQL